MREQPIKRVIDARGGQGRVIIHLGCRHTASLNEEELALVPATAHALGLDGHPKILTAWPCNLCPDEPEEKTVTQLWKEAGEP